MLTMIVATLSMFDAWVGPTTSPTYPPPYPGYAIRKVTPYQTLNSSGITMTFGGSQNGYGPVGTPAPTYRLTRTVVKNSEVLNGWGQPSWTAPFASVGDFSIDKYALPDPNSVIYVPDGSSYVHDVYIKNVSEIQTFSGFDTQPHQAGRGRSWDTLDHEDRHVE